MMQCAGKPFQIQGVAGSKVFYTDQEGNKIGLKEVVNLGIPQTAYDDLLYATITLPLINIKYQGESQ